jgi:hypothetical protein
MATGVVFRGSFFRFGKNVHLLKGTAFVQTGVVAALAHIATDVFVFVVFGVVNSHGGFLLSI